MIKTCSRMPSAGVVIGAFRVKGVRNGWELDQCFCIISKIKCIQLSSTVAQIPTLSKVKFLCQHSFIPRRHDNSEITDKILNIITKRSSQGEDKSQIFMFPGFSTPTQLFKWWNKIKISESLSAFKNRPINHFAYT